METAFTIVKYLLYGFFGVIGLLVVLAVLFGKRVIKKWEYEAKFRDDRGREIGEFDVKMSRIDKEEADFTQKVKFRLRHPALKQHSTVRVRLDDVLVLEGMVEQDGRVRLGNEHQQNQLSRPEAGQLCRVECGGQELLAEPIYVD